MSTGKTKVEDGVRSMRGGKGKHGLQEPSNGCGGMAWHPVSVFGLFASMALLERQVHSVCHRSGVLSG